MEFAEFFKGKKILITGHTGFKGSWMCQVLHEFGAEVCGFSLEPPTQPSLFEIADIANKVEHHIGDVRDYDAMKEVFDNFQPEIAIHLAAQPIVRESYKDPVNTYTTNVIGTLNFLECIRKTDTVKSALNVTTDKVYLNRERDEGYVEDEMLDGYDPYSNSKSCSELVTHSYKLSFLDAKGISVSTARAGNVIGGGDFASDRIIPDCVRAQLEKKDIIVRNPYSTRPYQHVLEPIMAYLMMVKEQYENRELAGYYNVGPDDCDCVTTGQLVDLFCSVWGEGAVWKNVAEANAPHEANFLKLDCGKLKRVFAWQPAWHISEAIQAVCDWTKAWTSGNDISAEMNREINQYLESWTCSL